MGSGKKSPGLNESRIPSGNLPQACEVFYHSSLEKPLYLAVPCLTAGGQRGEGEEEEEGMRGRC